MRLWHYQLLPYLPKYQLKSQWRECVCIASNIYEHGTPNHILVNAIMDYPIEEFNDYGYFEIAKERLSKEYEIRRQ